MRIEARWQNTTALAPDHCAKLLGDSQGPFYYNSVMKCHDQLGTQFMGVRQDSEKKGNFLANGMGNLRQSNQTGPGQTALLVRALFRYAKVAHSIPGQYRHVPCHIWVSPYKKQPMDA